MPIFNDTSKSFFQTATVEMCGRYYHVESCAVKEVPTTIAFFVNETEDIFVIYVPPSSFVFHVKTIR